MEPSNAIEAWREKFFEHQARAVRIENSHLDESEIVKRIADLKAETIYKEENRPLSEKLQKIWNMKVRPR